MCSEAEPRDIANQSFALQAKDGGRSLKRRGPVAEEDQETQQQETKNYVAKSKSKTANARTTSERGSAREDAEELASKIMEEYDIEKGLKDAHLKMLRRMKRLKRAAEESETLRARTQARRTFEQQNSESEKKLPVSCAPRHAEGLCAHIGSLVSLLRDMPNERSAQDDDTAFSFKSLVESETAAQASGAPQKSEQTPVPDSERVLARKNNIEGGSFTTVGSVSDAVQRKGQPEPVRISESDDGQCIESLHNENAKDAETDEHRLKIMSCEPRHPQPEDAITNSAGISVSPLAQPPVVAAEASLSSPLHINYQEHAWRSQGQEMQRDSQFFQVYSGCGAHQSMFCEFYNASVGKEAVGPPYWQESARDPRQNNAGFRGRYDNGGARFNVRKESIGRRGIILCRSACRTTTSETCPWALLYKRRCRFYHPTKAEFDAVELLHKTQRHRDLPDVMEEYLQDFFRGMHCQFRMHEVRAFISKNIIEI